MASEPTVRVERVLGHPRATVLAAWVLPDQLARWRGSEGWHVEDAKLDGAPRAGASHCHVKVRDADPSVRVSTDGIYTEYVEAERFVSREQVVGDRGVDPDRSLDLTVTVTDTPDGGTRLVLLQGPYRPDAAAWHAEAWEHELDRLATYLETRDRPDR